MSVRFELRGSLARSANRPSASLNCFAVWPFQALGEFQSESHSALGLQIISTRISLEELAQLQVEVGKSDGKKEIQ